MRQQLSVSRILPVAAAALLLVPGTAQAADQTVGEFEATQQAAWNAHDAGAYTAAFNADADIITALGWHWVGQADAARNIGDGFRFVYAQARLQLSGVQARVLTPDLVSVTLSWTIVGARAITTGSPATEQHGFETQLLRCRAASWVVLAQQDTAATGVPVPSQGPAQATPPVAAFPTTAPPVRRCIVGRANGDCLIYGKTK